VQKWQFLTTEDIGGFAALLNKLVERNKEEDDLTPVLLSTSFLEV